MTALRAQDTYIPTSTATIDSVEAGILFSAMCGTAQASEGPNHGIKLIGPRQPRTVPRQVQDVSGSRQWCREALRWTDGRGRGREDGP